jgi:hypothetical protein
MEIYTNSLFPRPISLHTFPPLRAGPLTLNIVYVGPSPRGRGEGPYPHSRTNR